MNESVEQESGAMEQPFKETRRPARSRGPGVIQLVVLVVILGGGVLFTSMSTDVTRTSEPGIRLMNGAPYLAERAGDWSGGPLQGLTENEKKVLPSDTEAARRVFTDSEGNKVYCTIILAGRDVTSIHRPELCLNAQGLKIQQTQVEPVPVASAPGGVLKVMRLDAIRDYQLPGNSPTVARLVFLYWFIGKERQTAHHWQRIFWTSRDRVLHNTNHRWAYIILTVPVNQDETWTAVGEAQDAAMQVAARFVKDIYPTIAVN